MSPPTMYPGVIVLDDHARSLEDQKRAHASSHQACQCDRTHHRRRRLAVLIPAVISLFVIAAVLAFSCLRESGFYAGLDSLVPRAIGDTNSSGSSGGSFVNHKFYLIVILVGLFVVLVLGVMLSAWCCRGSFENPLCCPCYLCACCGGLACLECIACGLCAEGLEQA